MKKTYAAQQNNAPDPIKLFKRDLVQINREEIVGCIKDKTVLVTGGGGSIGSELCRQIASLDVGKLIVLDNCEYNAYVIDRELREKYPDLDLQVIIGSVQDKKRVEDIFSRYKPQIVYHAAAYKHVPMMEASPSEAIKNNVFGTLNVANAAHNKAERFILISSDKAVNPTSIMGASKRICEMIVCELARRSETKFACVRFGNVMCSSGSVIPLFEKQIMSGGPVTVTHKDVIRYFMSIPEAVSLVLQAGVYTLGGEVFVLDMGEPVSIDELARSLIRLYGYEPDRDIKIVYTGLRPGEKLFEELLLREEGLDETANKHIFCGRPETYSKAVLDEKLKVLADACEADSQDIRVYVKDIVKEYLLL